MSVKAKFKCTGITAQTNNEGQTEGKSITLNAVVAYNADGGRNDENETWSKYTPSGTLNMYISNPGAFEQFEVGKEYYLTFEQAPAQ
jgi:hypothetical protein